MTQSLAEVLRAAGEPTRLRILNLLRQGSICVCDLQAILELPQSTVSNHLTALRHADLVKDERKGPRVMYSLSRGDTPQREALLEMLDKCAGFEESLRKDLEVMRGGAWQSECPSEVDVEKKEATA